jgi:L-threonylcarbamoyladenylate synthase
MGTPGMTRLILLDAGRDDRLPVPNPRYLEEMIASLRAGGAVIFPTDTLYGLGVDPCSEKGLSRLFAAKGRDRGKPIPLLLSGREQVDRWTRHVPPAAGRLMDRFWPGALTLVLPADPCVHPDVTGGGDTVGLRVPDHPVPRALAAELYGAVTGTSANRSGNPGAWESAEEIVREFTGTVDWILWGGAGNSPGSTVVRMIDDHPLLLREGVLPFRDIIEYLQKG